MITTGKGVYGFTLDPLVGEFIMSHENVKVRSYTVASLSCPTQLARVFMFVGRQLSMHGLCIQVLAAAAVSHMQDCRGHKICPEWQMLWWKCSDLLSGAYCLAQA